mmetsp:Transcript_10275/g.33957  ORF Transcript_10275/g.33957 Transcript_10275/m.33957 type:complete len:301 (+) Transcript_10275:376-1278(+)
MHWRSWAALRRPTPSSRSRRRSRAPISNRLPGRRVPSPASAGWRSRRPPAATTLRLTPCPAKEAAPGPPARSRRRRATRTPSRGSARPGPAARPSGRASYAGLRRCGCSAPRPGRTNSRGILMTKFRAWIRPISWGASWMGTPRTTSPCLRRWTSRPPAASPGLHLVVYRLQAAAPRPPRLPPLCRRQLCRRARPNTQGGHSRRVHHRARPASLLAPAIFSGAPLPRVAGRCAMARLDISTPRHPVPLPPLSEHLAPLRRAPQCDRARSRDCGVLCDTLDRVWSTTQTPFPGATCLRNAD